MDIMELIAKEAAKFNLRAGFRASKCYLGSDQMYELRKWAYDNGYTASVESPVDGEHRAEVNGLLVYEVNTELHLEFS